MIQIIALGTLLIGLYAGLSEIGASQSVVFLTMSTAFVGVLIYSLLRDA